MAGEKHNAYTIRVDILAFGRGGSDSDPVGVRRHSIRHQICAVGCGHRLHRSRDRVQDQDGLTLPRERFSPLTHLRHWLCTAPIVSVPIKVPVSADAMLSSELPNRYAATRVHHASRRRDGRVAARGARAAGDAGDRIAGPRFT